MRNVVHASSFLAMLFLAGGAVADEHADNDASILSPGKMEWQEGPKSLPAGAKLAVLEGDPTKEGPFVMRLRLPDGYTIPAYTHPKVERLTVISGKLDRKDAKKMPAGSFGFWAAGMKHFVWVEGETVVQLHGVGPWSIKYLNPADDPRNKQ